MTLVRSLFIVFASLLLAACGGGGEEKIDKTSIAISQTQADFQLVQNDSAIQPITVNVQFKGDGLIVGYPPNVPDVSWLSIEVVSNTTTTAVVKLTFRPYWQIGKYSTTVRFLTGRQDGSDLSFVDLPVTAEVFAPFDAIAPSLNFEQIIGAEQHTAPKAGYQISILGPKANWTITSNVDWLTFDKTSGSGASPVKVTVTKNAGAGNGIITIADAQSKRSRQISVRVDRKQNSLQATPQPIEFVFDTNTPSTELTKTFSMSDLLNSTVPEVAMPWAFKKASASWLKVDKTQGSTATVETLKVTVDNTINAVPTGIIWETLTFSYTTPDNVSHDVEILVKVTSSLPSIQVVAPHIIQPDKAGTLIIRGYGFNQLTESSQIKIGDNSYPIKSLQSDTQLTVDHPGFAAGRYPISLAINSVLPLQNGTLHVQAAEAMNEQSITAPGIRAVMTYDAERKRIYAYNKSSSELEVFSYQQGTWSRTHSRSFGDAKDLALTKDGKQLLAVVDAELWTIDITQDTLPAKTLLSQPMSGCNLYFKNLATLNDNKVAISSDYTNCSGFTTVNIYDLNQKGLMKNYSAYNSVVAASVDGSRLFIAQNGVSPAQEMLLIDTLSYQTIPTSAFGNIAAAELNKDGSKTFAGTDQVFDAQLQLHGNLGNDTETSNYVRLSQVRDIAWVLQVNFQAPYALTLKEIDISQATSGNYPLLRTIDLSDITDDLQWPNLQFEITPDDQTLLLSVPDKIIVRSLAVQNPVN